MLSIAAGILLAGGGSINAATATNINTRTIPDVANAVENGYIFKTFEVKVAENGDYFTDFWIMPAKYTDNSYTKFIVFVNDEYVGHIMPTKGNWQSACVNGKERLSLKAGINSISVGTLSPEIPAVETLKIASTAHEAEISSEKYEEFLKDAAEGLLYDQNIKETELETFSTDETGTVSAEFKAEPLNYTFWNEGYYTEGELLITTTSNVPHCIELYFFGTLQKGEIIRPSSNSSDINLSVTGIPGFGQLPDKPHVLYTPATEYQMRTLNGRSVSERSLNNTAEIATLRYNIPVEGFYIFRIRTLDNEVSGVADVIVNGDYFYENVPISCNFINYKIPIDNNEYSFITKCTEPGTADPYLFIHRDRTYNIIGYNDDNKNDEIQEQYSLNKLDSFFSQVFKDKVGGFSISSYSSSNPASTCDVKIIKNISSTQFSSPKRAANSSSAGVKKLSSVNKEISFPGCVDLSGNLNISSENKIENVKIYNLAGINIGSVEFEDSVLSIPLSELNVTETGIYILTITTVDKSVSGKIIVK